MGLESFGLTKSSACSISLVRHQLRGIEDLESLPEIAGDPGSYYEQNRPESIIEAELRPTDTGVFVSIRAALCCHEDCVDGILALARHVSIVTGDGFWQTLGGGPLVDVSSDDASSEAGREFARRRQILTQMYCLESIPPAAVRSGDECWAYVESYAARMEKGSQGMPDC